MLQRSNLVCLLLEAPQENDTVFRCKVGRYSQNAQANQCSRSIITRHEDTARFAQLKQLLQAIAPQRRPDQSLVRCIPCHCRSPCIVWRITDSLKL